DLVLLRRRYCVRPATNRWADQSANGFSCRGNARKTPALILAFSFCDSRKIIRSSLIRVIGHVLAAFTEPRAVQRSHTRTFPSAAALPGNGHREKWPVRRHP